MLVLMCLWMIPCCECPLLSPSLLLGLLILTNGYFECHVHFTLNILHFCYLAIKQSHSNSLLSLDFRLSVREDSI